MASTLPLTPLSIPIVDRSLLDVDAKKVKKVVLVGGLGKSAIVNNLGFKFPHLQIPLPSCVKGMNDFSTRFLIKEGTGRTRSSEKDQVLDISCAYYGNFNKGFISEFDTIVILFDSTKNDVDEGLIKSIKELLSLYKEKKPNIVLCGTMKDKEGSMETFTDTSFNIPVVYVSAHKDVGMDKLVVML